jgi:profilin
LRKKGIYFNEVYYTCIRADNESIYAKEVSEISCFMFVLCILKNNRGLILVKTKVYVLFGTFNDRMNPAIAIEAVEKLGIN